MQALLYNFKTVRKGRIFRPFLLLRLRMEEWFENIKLFLSRITQRVSIGPDPMTDFSISFEINPKTDNIDEILQLSEKSLRKKVAISLFVLTNSSRLRSSRIPIPETSALSLAVAKISSASGFLCPSRPHEYSLQYRIAGQPVQNMCAVLPNKLVPNYRICKTSPC